MTRHKRPKGKPNNKTVQDAAPKPRKGDIMKKADLIEVLEKASDNAEVAFVLAKQRGSKVMQIVEIRQKTDGSQITLALAPQE